MLYTEVVAQISIKHYFFLQGLLRCNLSMTILIIMWSLRILFLNKCFHFFKDFHRKPMIISSQISDLYMPVSSCKTVPKLSVNSGHIADSVNVSETLSGVAWRRNCWLTLIANVVRHKVVKFKADTLALGEFLHDWLVYYVIQISAHIKHCYFRKPHVMILWSQCGCQVINEKY